TSLIREALLAGCPLTDRNAQVNQGDGPTTNPRRPGRTDGTTRCSSLLLDCPRYAFYARRIRRGVRLHDGPPWVYPAARGGRVRRANRQRREHADQRCVRVGWPLSPR